MCMEIVNLRFTSTLTPEIGSILLRREAQRAIESQELATFLSCAIPIWLSLAERSHSWRLAGIRAGCYFSVPKIRLTQMTKNRILMHSWDPSIHWNVKGNGEFGVLLIYRLLRRIEKQKIKSVPHLDICPALLCFFWEPASTSLII